MMNERFTDCKMLIAFCYILSLALKGTATGTLEIQPTHDLCREKCYCQKDVQSCRCGEVLMPTKSQRSPKSSCSVVQSILTPKVSQNCFREHWGSCRAKWWWQPLKHRAAEPRSTSWHPPADCVCTRLSPRGHCAQSCDTQLNQRAPFQKGPVSTEKGQWQRLLPAQLQAAAVKDLPVPFWGDAREDYPPDSISENIHWAVPGVA